MILPEPMGDVSKGNGGTSHLGTIAVWLSGASMLLYFLFSYSLGNFCVLVADGLSKTLEILFR